MQINKIKKAKKKYGEADDEDQHLMLRTYELLDFIKKYLRKIENALKQIGINFIQKYCIEKMGSK